MEKIIHLTGANPGGAPVTVVIAALGFGGAERSALLTARGLARNGHPVEVITLADPASSPAFAVPPGVTLMQLGLARDSYSVLESISNNVRRLRRLAAVLRATRSMNVISFVHQTNVLTLLALAGSGKRVIACEESEPSVSTGSQIWDALRPLAYRLADVIVVHTRAAILSLPNALRARAVVIPNVVEFVGSALFCPALPLPAYTILAVGRLEYEKGFDILIDAFAQIANKFASWSLTIVGEGSQQVALQARIDRLGMRTRIDLAGVQPTSCLLYRSATIFASASRHEAFGLAIAEAMLAGCAVVATACPSGPPDLIEHGLDGLLVKNEDSDALAAGLATLMGDATLRAQLGRHAACAAGRYGAAAIDAQWARLLASGVVHH